MLHLAVFFFFSSPVTLHGPRFCRRCRHLDLHPSATQSSQHHRVAQRGISFSSILTCHQRQLNTRTPIRRSFPLAPAPTSSHTCSSFCFRLRPGHHHPRHHHHRTSLTTLDAPSPPLQEQLDAGAAARTTSSRHCFDICPHVIPLLDKLDPASSAVPSSSCIRLSAILRIYRSSAIPQ